MKEYSTVLFQTAFRRHYENLNSNKYIQLVGNYIENQNISNDPLKFQYNRKFYGRV